MQEGCFKNVSSSIQLTLKKEQNRIFLILCFFLLHVEVPALKKQQHILMISIHLDQSKHVFIMTVKKLYYISVSIHPNTYQFKKYLICQNNDSPLSSIFMLIFKNCMLIFFYYLFNLLISIIILSKSLQYNSIMKQA